MEPICTTSSIIKPETTEVHTGKRKRDFETTDLFTDAIKKIQRPPVPIWENEGIIPNCCFSSVGKPFDINNIESPEKITILDLSYCDVGAVDFTRFPNLKKINLYKAKKFTPDQIQRLPTSLVELNLYGCDVEGVDFSRFTNLQKIYLWLPKNFTDEQRAHLTSIGCRIIGI